jgi:stage V sporulation protein AF
MPALQNYPREAFEMDNYNKLTKEFRQKVPVGESFDLLERKLLIGGRKASMFFVDGLTNGTMMQRVLYSLLDLTEEQVSKAKNTDEFIAMNLPFLDCTVEAEVDNAIKQFYSGLVPLMISGLDKIIIIDCREYPARAVTEPTKEKSLRGAKDGFVESMMTNIALIRRRIRDNNLIFKSYQLGTVTKTDVVMVYMKGQAPADMVEKLEDKINNVKVGSMTLTEQTLVEVLTGKGKSLLNPFPKVRYTQRPDVIAAHVEEGKIAIIVDNSPTVILIPTGLFDFAQDVDDYYFPMITGSYFRLLRIANILMLLFATPVYLLFAEGHVPVHSSVEFFITGEDFAIGIFWQFILLEVAIDGLKLASLNTPDSLGMSLSVIGALIMGEFSVSSGWFVPQTILCMAVVALAGFTQPSIELSYAIKFTRVLMLIGAHVIGIYGVIIGFLLAAMVVISTRTIVGTSYLYPLIPWNGRALKRLMLRTSGKDAP